MVVIGKGSSESTDRASARAFSGTRMLQNVPTPGPGAIGIANFSPVPVSSPVSKGIPARFRALTAMSNSISLPVMKTGTTRISPLPGSCSGATAMCGTGPPEIAGVGQ